MNFNTRINSLESQISKNKRSHEKVTKLEERSRRTWTKLYHTYSRAVDRLISLKRHGTKKEADLIKKIRNWPTKSVALTKERDSFRVRMVELQEEAFKFAAEHARLSEQKTGEAKAVDEIVAQVFSLNRVVVESSKNREEYLTNHIFPRLFDKKGDLRSQVSFTSMNSLRRVVAMVNTITLVQGDMAGRAMELIQQFFDHFQKTVTMDSNIKALYELTKQLLIEKTCFKVGPDLYRFLSMELDKEVIPELHEAQQLLRQSIRSEKTTKYIRIYERKSRNEGWEAVRQS